MGVAIWAFLLLAPALAAETRPLIGESERVYTLAPENTEVRGLALDETRPEMPRLLVLDGAGKVFSYGFLSHSEDETDELKVIEIYDLATATNSSRLSSTRGLAFTMEDGHAILYFLDWNSSQTGVESWLWRYDVDSGTAARVDLSQYAFRIGDREVFDVACDDGGLLVSFDASGHPDPNLRVQRGIVRIAWNGGFGESPACVRHLPDAGTAPARGLATMQLDGAGYLWATIGNEQIYCADARTGRGLFFFDRPKSREDSLACWGLGFGRDALWVSENVPGPDRVHRVNVTKNPDAFYEGPRVLRRLIMQIETEPEAACEEAGAVYHYYSRPYAYEQLHNQGIWPETETIVDVSAAPNATIKQVTHDPAGDVSSRQTMWCLEYASAPARSYSSRYEIDLWTNPYKKFVYPHRTDRDCAALAGTDYLADDAELYNLADTATYEAFLQRVRSHIEEKYDVAADMENPYWAARNVVEYIQDTYYYPNRSKRVPATVDYARKHYDANPGNLKIELSAAKYDKSQIIACSGTSVMVAGAMRYLGIPARWLGTGTQYGPSEWDTNGNGLLDPDETAGCTNGHRYTQVWLGSHYGWICFDATPSKPPFNDYDVPPPLQPQWRYMTRAASGHREEKRIVFNVGSGLLRPLYREFEYDETLALDNNCGGDQRYNLQARYEKPELWKLGRHHIQVKNLCFIKGITATGPRAQTRVAWELDGAWQKIAAAKVSVYLQQRTADSNPWRDVARLAEQVACDAGSITVDLSAHQGQRFRVIIRRDGDAETGGVSEPFDLE